MLNVLIKLLEDNPWHDAGGKFAKGGHKTARMWSLYGKRKSVSKGKGGKVSFKNLTKLRQSLIKDWRKNLGPHPDQPKTHKPPYRGKR